MNRNERRQQKKQFQDLNPEVLQTLELLKTANSYQESNELDKAEEICRQILQNDPENIMALSQLGMILHKKGQLFTTSISYINKSLTVDKTNYLAHYYKGEILLDNNQLVPAIDSFKQAIQINPSHVLANLKLAMAYRQLREFDLAEATYKQVLRLSKDNVTALHGLAFILFEKGMLDESIAAYRKILSKSSAPITHSNLLLSLNYDSSQSATSLFHEHVAWDKHYTADIYKKATAPHDNTKILGRPLNIGYVSSDFSDHRVARFLLPTLKNHDKKQVRIYCYANNTLSDRSTLEIKKYVDHWRPIRNIPDEKVAEMIREDKIDILVDLSGHRAGNRLALFAHKPAPVHMSWLGYVNTTGLSAIDYFISDVVHNPPGTEQYYSEKIIRLPDCYITYEPRYKIDKLRKTRPSMAHKFYAGYDITEIELAIKDACYNFWKNFAMKMFFLRPLYRMSSPKPAGSPPVLKNKRIHFSNFNHIAKLNEGVIELWSQILLRIPNSCLLLKSAEYDHPESVARITEAFAKHHVGAGQLQFSGWSSVEDLYQQYRDVDIALDPFPFNGGATTFDALWMGVPVVTIAGETTVSRQSATYLSHMGLSELVTHNKEDYVALVCNIANDVGRLTALRKNLRQRLLASPLCDGKRFANNIEAAYRQVWTEWCSKG